MFDEAHAAGDLRREAIRLTRALIELMPHEAEARLLLAQMLLHEKRPQRTSVVFPSSSRALCEIS
jgi:predicted RNA polymerase sigma factor